MKEKILMRLFGIKVKRNILSDEERLKALETFTPHLLDLTSLGETNPALQSRPNLHEFEEHKWFFDLMKERLNIKGNVLMSWIIGWRSDCENCWHNHGNFNRTSVLYSLENPEEKGTWFRKYNFILKTKTPTNSALIFPSKLDHSPPDKVKLPRYTLAIDYDTK